jgi:Yip1-like protein
MATNPSVPIPAPPSAQPSAELAPLSEGQRLIDVFFAPSKTFTDLRRNANWWAPFLISAIISISFVYVADQKVGFRKIADNQLQSQPKQADQVERMAPAEREKNAQARTMVTKWVSYGFSALILIWYVVVAAVLLATLKFGLSAEVKFKTLLAMVVYASLPNILKAILAAASLLAGVAGDAFTFQNPVATNPGYFVDAVTNPVLHAFLTSFDVFGIWTMILGAIGITCISKVKLGSAFAVVFGWFAILILIGVGFTAVFS